MFICSCIQGGAMTRSTCLMLTDADALNTRITGTPARSPSSGAHYLHYCLKKAEILAILDICGELCSVVSGTWRRKDVAGQSSCHYRSSLACHQLNSQNKHISVHLSLVLGDKFVDFDISGGRRSGGGNRVSELVSQEVRTKMMMAIPGVPGEDYPILSSEVKWTFDIFLGKTTIWIVRHCPLLCQALNFHVQKRNSEVRVDLNQLCICDLWGG